MTPEAAQRLEKIRVYSTSLRRLFQFLFVLVALAVVVQTILLLTGAEPYGASVRIGITEFIGDSIPQAIRTIAWLGATLHLIILAKLNLHLIKLFRLYSSGMLFDRQNVYQIRQVGITVLLFPALWVLGVIVAGFLPAESSLTRVVGSGQDPFSDVMVGTIIIVVAWIMDVGRELREEQDLVV